ncbi:MAG: hypothetical protein H0V97_00870 [Actinobacteria bacterium]|nr:hypothetical protein [Actinomycetota bacterium]
MPRPKTNPERGTNCGRSPAVAKGLCKAFTSITGAPDGVFISFCVVVSSASAFAFATRDID